MSWVTRLQNNQIIVINGVRVQMKTGNRIAVLDEAEIVKLPLEEEPDYKPIFRRNPK